MDITLYFLISPVLPTYLDSTLAAVTVRRLPDDTLRALKPRTATSGRSTEAEIHEILANAVRSPVALGSAPALIGQQLGGVEIEPRQTRNPVRPAWFT